MSVPDETKPKGAQKDFYFRFDGYTKPSKKWQGEQTDAYDDPIYSTASDVITELASRGIPFLDALAKRTALAKDLGTYYWEEDKKGKRKGMLTLVGEDGIIHHKLNHTSTVTSRMSSSDPNLQNIPRGDTSSVKKMFRSRFENGRMAEIDYSQLEVVVQGVLSGDPQLVKDLNDQVDFHCKRLSAKLGEDYSHVWKMCHEVEDPTYESGRTKAKQFSFQRAYGAGAPAIAASTGMSVEEVKELIQAEESLYPGVVEFDKSIEEEIIKSRVPTGNKLYVDGVPFAQGEGHWDSPTGTRFCWREGITPEFLHEKGKYTGFSPTERKNYPMQGVGGEIVQTMLGKVFRYFIKNDRFGGDVLLVNTVHDCVILDGKDGVLQPVAKAVQGILEAVPQVYEKALGIKINVPFPCKTEVGKDLFAKGVLH
jgi:DNA polymerase I-like protein with 3'-5' exonuclease and polymerase domains